MLWFVNFSDSNVRRVRRRDALFGRGEQEWEPHPGQHHFGGERQSESGPGNYKMGTERLKMRYEGNVGSL